MICLRDWFLTLVRGGPRIIATVVVLNLPSEYIISQTVSGPRLDNYVVKWSVITKWSGTTGLRHSVSIRVSLNKFILQ